MNISQYNISIQGLSLASLLQAGVSEYDTLNVWWSAILKELFFPATYALNGACLAGL
jgi:hypothetical protein